MPTIDDDDDFDLRDVPLAEPRPLTPLERALIDFLLDDPLGREELRSQAETAQVDGVCNCGCPSVTLAVDRGLPPAVYRPEEVTVGRTELVYISASQPKRRRPWTDVHLVVADGYLESLEIWAGKYGVRPRVDPAKLERWDWTDTEDSE